MNLGLCVIYSNHYINCATVHLGVNLAKYVTFMKSSQYFKPSFAIPICLGLIAFFAVCGLGILNTQNIAWLSHLDPAQHYLGWAFFRNSPWSWPPGLNPSYGLEISSSIVFSDSIPLLAFLFKPFTLAPIFQYFGLWTLTCFILQAVFAWLIGGLYIRNLFLRALLCALLVFFPPMLWRVGEHAALAGHFLILASIYLNLRPHHKNRNIYWLVLILTSSLVHFYLLSMVLCLWLADLLDCRTDHTATNIPFRKSLIIEILSIVLLLPIVLWLAGYFAIGQMGSIVDSAATGLYGVGRMNLLAIINSQGWSYWLPSIATGLPGSSEQDLILSTQEGFSYLGLGNLLLCMLATVTFFAKGLRVSRLSSHRFLVILTILMLIFAVSNNVGLGPYNFHFPLPERISAIASIFRASGRFAWVAFYLLVLMGAFIIAKSYTQKVAAAILLLCAALQIIDTSAGWLGVRHRLSVVRSENTNALSSSLWQSIGNQYTQLREFPLHVGAGQAHWEKLGFYAASHGMSTSVAFLSRSSPQKTIDANQKFAMSIATGDYREESLYIIGDTAVLPVSQSLRSGDVFVRLNDMNVLLPQGATKLDSKLLADVQFIKQSSARRPLIGEVISFAKYQSGVSFLNEIDGAKTIGHGWAHPEDWGVWSEGEKASLTLLLPGQGRVREVKSLALDLKTFAPGQVIQIMLNDRLVKLFKSPIPGISQLEVPINSEDQAASFMRLDFVIQKPVSPRSLGLGDDSRKLGVGLISAQFQ
jgi:hypothetical protein